MEMPSGVKRPYDASRRRALADETRQHVIEASRPLFLEQGYEATSMRQVAAAAGVSLQTLYNGFGSKFGLFRGLIDVTVAGDHEPVALADRAEVRALDELDDPEAVVRAAVAVTLPVLVRMNEFHPVVRAAAVSDPEVAEAYQRFAVDGRWADSRTMAARLGDLQCLPPGRDVDWAADVIFAVLSDDTFHLLVAQRRWSPEAFAEWATATLLATLVDSG
jgi:AcrR family transcriptional regulator